MIVCAACVVVLLGGVLEVVRLRGLGCCGVLWLRLGGAQRLVARGGGGGLWRDEGCARRASCMVYSIILALFLAVGRSRVGGRIVVAK